MKRVRILLNFPRLSDVALDNKCSFIISSMKGNVYFPVPDPSLDDVYALLQQFSAAALAAKNRDRLKISQKKDIRVKLEALLVNLAYYVTGIAKGDRTILISSGFDVSAETNGTGTLGKVEDFSVKNGDNDGEIVLKAKAVDNAQSYVFCYGIAGAMPMMWQQVETTSASTVLEDLEVGKAYSFYLKAVGTNNQFAKSVIITKTVS